MLNWHLKYNQQSIYCQLPTNLIHTTKWSSQLATQLQLPIQKMFSFHCNRTWWSPPGKRSYPQFRQYTYPLQPFTNLNTYQVLFRIPVGWKLGWNPASRLFPFQWRLAEMRKILPTTILQSKVGNREPLDERNTSVQTSPQQLIQAEIAM